MQQQRKGIFYGWIIVIAGFLIATVTFAIGFSFGVFLNPFRETFAASSAAASTAYSISMFAYCGIGVVTGWAGDKYGVRIVAVSGGVLLGVALVLTSMVQTLWQLYLTYALIGVSMSPAWVPLLTTVSRWFKKRRGITLGIISSGIGAGPLIMAPIATHLIYTSGWRFTFYILALTTLLIIAAALFLKRSPQEIGQLPDGVPAAPNSETEAGKGATDLEGFTLREAVGTRAFWLLSIMNLTIAIGPVIVLAHIVAFGQSKGLLPITAALVLSTVSGTSVVGRILMGMAADWMGSKRTMIICVSMLGVMLLSLVGPSNIWIIFLFAVIFGFFYGGYVPQIPALTAEILGLGHMGAVFGATSFFWGVGAALGPVLAGYILDTTGSYSIAFIIGAVAMFLTAAMCAYLKKPTRKPIMPGV